MTFSRFLLHDFWTAREFNRIEDGQRSRNRAARRIRSKQSSTLQAMSDRLDELEDDLGQAILLVRALSELTLDKGLVTSEELGAKLRELDLADGVADGKTGFDLPPEDPSRDGDES